MEALLRHGAAADKARTTDGQTPLIIASMNGHHPVVEALLQHGAAADYLAKNGTTPLSIASSKRNHDVVKLLRYFTKPTSEHSVTMAMLMLEKLVVYHHLECLSIIELFQMMNEKSTNYPWDPMGSQKNSA